VKIALKIIVLVMLALIFACNQRAGSNIILSDDASSDSVSQILNNSTITAYKDGSKHWQLNADEILQMNETNQIRANPVRLTLFADEGVVNAILTSDSAITNARTDTFFVWGNVNITAHSGEKLLAQTLQWQTRENLLVSDGFVELRSADGEIMRGRGFRAAENFEWWNFAHEVSGNFPSINAEFERGGN